MAYIQEYKTKPTINGIVYYLTVNHEEKTFSRNCLAFGGIRVTQAELRSIITNLKMNGYTEK